MVINLTGIVTFTNKVLLQHSHAHSFIDCLGLLLCDNAELSSYDKGHVSHEMKYLLPDTSQKMLACIVERALRKNHREAGQRT